MAFLPPSEENKAAPTGQTTGGPITQPPPTSGGSAGAGAGATKAGAAPGVGTPTQFGTSSTKLGDYLSANAPQIQSQASNIAGNLGTQYGQAVGNIGQAVNQFGQQVKSGYTGFDQTAIDQAVQNALKGQVGQQDVQAVQSRINNAYSGPQSFQETDPYTQIQGDVQKAAQNASLLTSPAGVKSYYQGNYGQEAPGMATLDTALLTGNPEAYGQVQQAAQPFSGLGSYLSQQTAQANTAVPAAQAEIEQGKQYATQALGTQEQNLQNQINQAVTQRQTAAQTQNDQILAALRGKNPTPENLAVLGITPDQWNALQNQLTTASTARKFENRNAAAMSTPETIDLTQFLQQQNPNAAITAGNVATPEQYAQANALAQLAAGGWSNPLAAYDAAQAGKAPATLSQFNYQDALNKAQSTVQGQNAATQAFVDAIQAGQDVEHAQQRAAEVAKGQQYSFNAAMLNPVTAPLAVATQIPVIGQPISRAVNTVVNTVSNVFCFEGHTEVEMADGSTKEIKKIDLGDLTKGGEVLGTIQAYVDSIYTYEGVEVSGKHAVKENGKWVRVENSDGKRFKTLGKIKVYCLITSKHRIFANGVEFADYVETDKYEDLSIDQSLEALNSVA